MVRWYEHLEMQLNHPPKEASSRHPRGRWFYGSSDYAHPALRWLSLPLFRLVMFVFLVALFTNKTGHGWTAWKITAVALLGISTVAAIANSVMLRAESKRQ